MPATKRVVYLCGAFTIPDDVHDPQIEAALHAIGVDPLPCDYTPEFDDVAAGLIEDEPLHAVIDLSPAV